MNMAGALLASRAYVPEEYDLDDNELDQAIVEKSVIIFKHFKPHLEKNEWKMAEKYFKQCLGLSPDTYKLSIHQKAKTGLQRLKKQ